MNIYDSALFKTYNLGSLELKNRVVMAPMSRCRAQSDNTPTDIMATYYSQRASAGLIVTEGIAPSQNGAGQCRIPGLYTPSHVTAWKPIVQKIHESGGRVFAQIMHTGRVGHVLNMHESAEVLGPTDQPCPVPLWTDRGGMLDCSKPRRMEPADIEQALNEIVHATIKANDAGFDGVEIHAGNGFLLDQFLNESVNTRDDEYGGDASRRNHLTERVVAACSAVLSTRRLGLRISPYGCLNGMAVVGDPIPQYLALLRALRPLGLAYVHVIDHGSIGGKAIPGEVLRELRKAFNGPVIKSGGLTAQSAVEGIESQEFDLAAFGRPYVANPDLVMRLRNGFALNEADANKYFSPGPDGYINYPTMVDQITN